MNAPLAAADRMAAIWGLTDGSLAAAADVDSTVVAAIDSLAPVAPATDRMYCCLAAAALRITVAAIAAGDCVAITDSDHAGIGLFT